MIDNFTGIFSPLFSLHNHVLLQQSLTSRYRTPTMKFLIRSMRPPKQGEAARLEKERAERQAKKETKKGEKRKLEEEKRR